MLGGVPADRDRAHGTGAPAPHARDGRATGGAPSAPPLDLVQPNSAVEKFVDPIHASHSTGTHDSWHGSWVGAS